MYTHYLGLDLGQVADFTALCLLEESVWIREEALRVLALDRVGWHAPGDLTPYQVDQARAWAEHYGRPADPPLAIRHLARPPLGTPYPAVVEHVAQLRGTAPLRPETTAIVVDQTGVGRAVCDQFRQAGVPIIPVTIHAGHTVSGDTREGLHVPKRELVGAAQVLLQGRRLKIAQGLPEAPTLLAEMQHFKVKIDPRTAHDSYSAWREGQHDDLVLAACLAVWFRGWYCEHLDHAARDAERRHTDASNPLPRDDAAMHRSALIHAARQRTQGVPA
ncbi:MAG: hypothetical protein AVDCRST_MAG77-2867 [uncultured Chloroflexi bacterium]|uniref:Terminase large subunit gp17-like C-terminal domain-containing protein n=1 Tax=uncultured Chloroflexota bacterium TaxID=166587 RepID=A0A6J4J0J0_9CHLR|nr:MAG: hypothetical protein AVDCRST_MAG77-2867 [uncultured Chloroflexota bacterium]